MSYPRFNTHQYQVSSRLILNIYRHYNIWTIYIIIWVYESGLIHKTVLIGIFGFPNDTRNSHIYTFFRKENLRHIFIRKAILIVHPKPQSVTDFFDFRYSVVLKISYILFTSIFLKC